MFHEAKVIRDANGVPTGISGIAQISLVNAALRQVTGIASSDDLVIPETMIEKIGLALVNPAIAATAQKKMDTGTWGIPFLKPAV